MANKNNHTCVVCGKEYYACNYCEQQHNYTPWKAVCCSHECYKEYLKQIFEQQEKEAAQNNRLSDSEISEEQHIVIEITKEVSNTEDLEADISDVEDISDIENW